MNARWWIPALALGVVVWRLAPSGTATLHATPPQPLNAPAVLLLEADPLGDHTDVVLRTPGAGAQAATVGTVPHVPGSARRAVPCPDTPSPCALVVVAERPSRGASTYDSALFRVEAGRATRLAGGLTNASRPMVTTRGTVLVQRGREGDDPTPGPDGRVRTERVDDLTLDAVDPRTGALRAVWSGRGQLAFLATPLPDGEVLIYHLTPSGAWLFALATDTGNTRALAGPMPALSRDFSYDPAHDEVVFASASCLGSELYDVVSLPAHAPHASPRTRFQGLNDHLMPRALRDGAVALSLPGDLGLGLLRPGSASPARLAPEGDGRDAALDETRDGRWVALRHATAQREHHTLWERPTGRTVTLDRPEVYTEFVGFAGEGGAQ